MNIRAVIAALALLTAAPLAMADGNVEAGKVKAETCKGCHGIPDYTNAYPDYRVPKIAGQHATYIESALKAYRDGDRNHPTMSAQAGAMSDQDIADIAAYLSSLKAENEPVEFAAGNVADGEKKSATCAGCHGAKGEAPAPMYPELAGQYPDYLLHALQAYKAGERKNPIMPAMVGALSDQDMKDLAAFFAAQKGTSQLHMIPLK